MFKIAYFSATGSDLIILSKVLKRIISNQGKIIEIEARSQEDMMEPAIREEFINYVKTVDFLFIYLHGGKDSCPGFDRMIEALPEKARVHVQPSSVEGAEVALKYSTVSKEERKKISHYFRYGGEKNLYNMLLFAVKQFGNLDLELEEPQPLPWEGIYHPEIEDVPSFEEYYRNKLEPDRPTVGIWFHRSQWLNNNTNYIDVIIKEIEARGANALPVFLNSYKDDELGNLGAGEVIDKFFIKDGQLVIDVLINLLMFSLDMGAAKAEFAEEKERYILEKLGIPVLKGIVSLNEREEWEESFQGLNPMDITISVAMPEFDGNLITLPVAFKKETHIDSLTGAKIIKSEPHQERIKRLVNLSLNWARLRYIPNSEKRIAIIFHNYPPRNDNIGSAFGLDSPASVWNILKELQNNGYTLDHLPEDGQALMKEILSGVTNDRSWASAEQMAARAVDAISAGEYKKWFAKLPAAVKDDMVEAWGDPPGDLFYYHEHLLVPGIINGNIFIGIQPPRGFLEDPASIYHSPDLPIPHHYYAYYEWIRDVFKADAVIHIGKHGSLEWLPGKSAGLSRCCYPDIAIWDLPNIYPYIINNPGEGTQAKRRSYCCIIDHLVPVMHNADTYEELAELEIQLEDYYQSKTINPGKLSVLKEIIWEKVCEANLHHDLGLAEKEVPVDFDAFLEDLHAYLSEIKDTQIRDGLHIFGEPPVDNPLVEFLVALTRLANGDMPSLREAIARLKGYDLDDLLANRGQLNNNDKTNGQLIEEIHQLSLKLVSSFADTDFDSRKIKGICRQIFGKADDNIEKVLNYMSSSLVPRIRETVAELSNTVNALEGRFVPPGPSGAPTRGMIHILPTGRNFYSVNPRAIPSCAAWKVGVDLANDLLNRYLEDEGKYPENIGLVLWGSPTMRTKGDDIAEALYLMGVKPVWEEESGYIKGVEIIPLEELGRPRIDVTFRVSGFLRDAFPNIIELLDEAVKMVVFLDEPPSQNFIAKHVKEEIDELVAQGIELEKARQDSCYRIFSCKPGAYGAGVSDLIDSKNWEDDNDLGEVYVVWGGYAYGSDTYGEKKAEIFKKRLSRLDIAVKNADTREYDMMDSDDFYSYHGGMIAAVRAFKGKAPKAYIGDSSDPQRVKTRTTAEEARHVFRARILNPKWIESMKRHGYKGAADISRAVDIAFGWDATAEAMDDWMYDKLAEKFVLDKEFTDWLKDVNPWALRNISERLLEAIQRGMWNAGQEMQDKLKKKYLEIEGDLEEYQDK